MLWAYPSHSHLQAGGHQICLLSMMEKIFRIKSYLWLVGPNAQRTFRESDIPWQRQLPSVWWSDVVLLVDTYKCIEYTGSLEWLGTCLCPFLDWNEFVKWLPLLTAENHHNFFHLWHHWKPHDYSPLQNYEGLCQFLETLAMVVSFLPIPSLSNFISISYIVTLCKLLDDALFFVQHQYVLNFTWVMAKFGPCLEKQCQKKFRWTSDLSYFKQYLAAIKTTNCDQRIFFSMLRKQKKNATDKKYKSISL